MSTPDRPTSGGPRLTGRALARCRLTGLKQADYQRLDVQCGEAGQIGVAADAVVSIRNESGASVAWLTALGEEERVFSLAALELPSDACSALDTSAYDHRTTGARRSRHRPRAHRGR